MLGRLPAIAGSASPISERYPMPPMMPPISGATQNSQSCPSAQPPANTATPVLRAGLTDVLVTGMEIRWIRVSPSPIAIAATRRAPCRRWHP